MKAKKTVKRAISTVVIALLCIAMLPNFALSVSAATEYYYYYEIIDGEAIITDCDEEMSGELYIADELGGYPVTIIAESAFENCENLTYIDVPNTVEYIGDYAFRGCTALEEIYLSYNLLTIEDYVFAGCWKLSAIAIPNGVSYIGHGAFLHCVGLKNITIPRTVTEIGINPFASCYSLEGFKVNTGNQYYHVDGNCLIETRTKTIISSCKNSTIPKKSSVTKIGISAFSDTLLTAVVIPENVTYIEESAFYYSENLKSVLIPESVKYIGESAFDDANDVTILCNKGSYADKYAKRMHIPVEYLPEKVVNVFDDLHKNDWYVKSGAIDFVYSNGLFKGTSDCTFSPNASMTRGMFVTVLGRLHGVKANNNAKTKFVDVKKDYYAGYVKWASDNGIVSGTDGTHFSPNANITREQICAMMQRYCKYAGIKLKKKNKEIKFLDAGKISAYARSAVKACQMGGVVSGEKTTGGYNFRPAGNATRAEVATIMMNFAKNYIK